MLSLDKIRAASYSRSSASNEDRIDNPRPRTEINAICDEIHRVALEDVDLSVFDSLSDGDVLFIDNSHRAFMNSDVTCLLWRFWAACPET